jgi:hypothetical protein
MKLYLISIMGRKQLPLPHVLLVDFQNVTIVGGDDRNHCPAKEAVCHKCSKIGHFSKVCRSRPAAATRSSVSAVTLASICSTTDFPSSMISAALNGVAVKTLIDTGSSDNFICERIAKSLALKIFPKTATVSMASSNLCASISGGCSGLLTIKDRSYNDVEFSVLPNLCADIILGYPFLRIHKDVSVSFGGPEPSLRVCSAIMKVPQAKLFQNLTADCYPVATKSRRFSASDDIFIEGEIQRMLREGIIEPSNSPWRAQIVLTSSESRKRRMVVDFSRTINRFTMLDAYPLPRIDDLVNEVAKHKFFSVIDLSSAYYQIEIDENDRPYTAFQACNNLYQFTRIPMGVTNGVAAFQRVMNTFIAENNLESTYAYLDDLTICGSSKDEHDRNLARFWDAAQKYNLTLNKDKCKFMMEKINVLGYSISEGELSPDPERMRPLLELPLPRDSKSLQRIIGFFAYYAKWVPMYSSKVRPLIDTKSFPLTNEAISSFESMKKDITNAMVHAINDNIPFTLETDASDAAIGATLLQEGRPVAFFSRSLNKAEKNHHIVEKEAYAIIESVRKWRHFLAGRHFNILTDQRAVSFMFDSNATGKIKNDKILRWRIEISAYSFDIKYRPGNQNVSADVLSRAFCAASYSSPSLEELHSSLIHPGVQRMLHFVRVRNLPYSVEEVRRVTSNCKVCAKCKPQFYKPEPVHLIKSLAPFERLSIDFKGPLPTTSSNNRYILTIVDEYTRFPFAFPCRDMSSSTVIKCLTNLFSIFGMPAYIHSDRGRSFMATDLQNVS